MRFRFQYARARIAVLAFAFAEHLQGRLQSMTRQPVQDLAQALAVIVCGCWIVPLAARGPELLDSSVYLRQFDLWPGYDWVLGSFLAVGLFNLFHLIVGASPTDRHKLTSPMVCSRMVGFVLAAALFWVVAVIQNVPGLTPGSLLFGFLGLSQLWSVAQVSWSINVAHRGVEIRRDEAEREREKAKRSATTTATAILS